VKTGGRRAIVSEGARCAKKVILAIAALSMLVALLLSTSALAASETFVISQITSNGYSVSALQVSGDRVVWTGLNETGYEIFTWTPSGGTVQLTANSYSDSGPAVSGDRIVWAGYDGNDDEIFTWTPGEGTVQLTDNSYSDSAPAVSGDRIVWTGYDGTGYEVFTWTPSGGTAQVTSNSSINRWPQVSGDRIVWETRAENGVSELSTWTPSGGTVDLGDYSSDGFRARVSGDRVVWDKYDWWGSQYDRYYWAYTWTPTGGKVYLGSGGSRSPHAPRVSGDRIVWQGMDGTDKKGVFTWTPSGGTVQLSSDSRSTPAPQVSGDRVVWQGTDGTDDEIFTWTPGGGTVQLTSNSSYDSYPVVSGDRIVWQGTDGTDDAIFTAVPAAPPPPDVTYTITASAGSDGSISPSGPQTVNPGDSITFAITPDPGYYIVDVYVDDVLQGATTSYEFTNVSADHSISASFLPSFSPDPDGWQFPNGSDKTTSDDTEVWRRIFGWLPMSQEAYRWELAKKTQDDSNAGIFDGGTCGGFATSSALLFTSRLSLSADFGLNSSYTTPWDWGPGELGYPEQDPWWLGGNTIMGPMSEQAREEIEALQILFCSTAVNGPVVSNEVNLASSQWVASLRGALQTGPQLIDIWSAIGGHALVGYKAVPHGDDHVYVYVYDSNHPGDATRYIDIDTVTHRWYYDGGVGLHFGDGSADDNSISWYSPEVSWQALESAPLEYYKTVVACYAASSVHVVDALGRISGTDGVTWSWEIPGIKPFIDSRALSGSASDSGWSFVGPDPGDLTFLLTPGDERSYATRFGRTENDVYLGMSWADAAVTGGPPDRITVSPNGKAMTVAPAAASRAHLALVADQAPSLSLDVSFAPRTPGADRLAVSTSDLPTGIALSIVDTGALADTPLKVGWLGGDGVAVDLATGGRAEVDFTGGAAAGQTSGATTVTVKIDSDNDGTWEQTTTGTIGQPPSDPQEPFIPSPDTTPPTTTATGADALWHNTPVTVTFTAIDDPGGSGMSGGLAKTEYKLDSGFWTSGVSVTVPAPADHSGDGVHTLSYRSTDAAGNVEGAQSVTIKIDTTAPAPAVTSFTPNSGPVGTTVTINGTGFSATPGSNKIRFNSGPAVTPTTASATQLTAVVPAGASSGRIRVITADGTATSTDSFTVTTLGSFTLAYVAGPHGRIDGSTNQTVASGASGTAVTAVPDPGYHFVGWSDGLATATRTDSNVRVGLVVSASFAPAGTYTVNASVSGGHGSALPLFQSVSAMGTAGITISPDPGYHIAAITLDGVPVAISNPLVLANVSADHTVVVTFSVDSVPDFPDVPPDHEFYSGVMYLANLSVVAGYADGSFGLYDPTLRAQVAKMLVLAFDLYSESITPPVFSDVLDTGLPYPFHFVQSGARAHILWGFPDRTFQPYQAISRMQFVRMVVRAAGSRLATPPPGYDAGFTDVAPEDDAFVAIARYNGLIDGVTPTTFAPGAPATRGHVAKILATVLQLQQHP